MFLSVASEELASVEMPYTAVEETSPATCTNKGCDIWGKWIAWKQDQNE